MIKFSHSIFALPFALSSAVVAAQGFPDSRVLVLIILCMVFARNTAMAFNRLVDAELDAANPRTASRHIPSGQLSKNYVRGFIGVNALLFMAMTYLLNSLSFYLSPVALLIICFYSFSKRFTNLTQLFLGLALGISPVAAWIAVTNSVSFFSVILGCAVFFWVAGFDLIYASQDYEFDQTQGVKSLMVKLGLARGLLLARGSHALCFIIFVIIGISYSLGLAYLLCLVPIAGLFLYEHSLIQPTNLSQVNQAFFTVNSFIGVLFFAGILLAVF